MENVHMKARACNGAIDHGAAEFQEHARQVAQKFYEMLVESKKLMEEGNGR